MNILQNIDKDNFQLYAMKFYENPQCLCASEFEEDIAKFKYLKKQLTIYVNGGELKERLILNHIITIYNLFSIVPSTRMLFYKMPENTHQALKTFLVYLRVLPDDETIELQINKIPLDINIINKLRKI